MKKVKKNTVKTTKSHKKLNFAKVKKPPSKKPKKKPRLKINTSFEEALRTVFSTRKVLSIKIKK